MHLIFIYLPFWKANPLGRSWPLPSLTVTWTWPRAVKPKLSIKSTPGRISLLWMEEILHQAGQLLGFL